MKGAGRRRVSRGSSDNVYTLLVGNGTIGKVYIESTVAKNVNAVRVDPGRAYVTHLYLNAAREGKLVILIFLNKEKLLVHGDLILSDNESSFKTEKVEEYLELKDITPLRFPPYMGHLMNPCDNR